MRVSTGTARLFCGLAINRDCPNHGGLPSINPGKFHHLILDVAANPAAWTGSSIESTVWTYGDLRLMPSVVMQDGPA
jgi:hypothetical protein